jgi:hypothetical protein
MAGARAGVALVLILLAARTGSAGPAHVDDTFDRYFRLEWQATSAAQGSEIAGYVENLGNVPVDRMRLTIDHLDASGAVVDSATTWVMGTVVPNHRSSFTARVAPAPAYRVRILTFDWSNCRD